MFIKKKNLRIASFFAGAGGLDLGFQQADFDVVWANEYDKRIWDTYRKNHPATTLDTRSITEIKPEELDANIDGIIGGPPCQSWSLAGAMRGIEDPRGRLFYDYIRMVAEIKPKFFLAENVKGMVSKRHVETYEKIKSQFAELGYEIYSQIFDVKNFQVPQERSRVIIVGIAKEYAKKTFVFPTQENIYTDKELHLFPKQFSAVSTLKEAIFDLADSAVPSLEKNRHNPKSKILNHEYMTGGFSPIYMSRNRIRKWDEPSFTIQASGRQAPLHPDSPPMKKVETDKWVFTAPFEKYRRLSVRECARIQTFPDDFEFVYDNVDYGYKMIGNAVPVRFAKKLAKAVKKHFNNLL